MANNQKRFALQVQVCFVNWLETFAGGRLTLMLWRTSMQIKLVRFLFTKVALTMPAYGSVWVLDMYFGFTPAEAVLWVGLATVPVRFVAHRTFVFSVKDHVRQRLVGSFLLWLVLFLVRYYFLLLMGEPSPYLYFPVMAAFGIGQALIEYVIFDRWLFRKQRT